MEDIGEILMIDETLVFDGGSCQQFGLAQKISGFNYYCSQGC
jgi:hypothetical protein